MRLFVIQHFPQHDLAIPMKVGLFHSVDSLVWLPKLALLSVTGLSALLKTLADGHSK